MLTNLFKNMLVSVNFSASALNLARNGSSSARKQAVRSLFCPIFVNLPFLSGVKEVHSRTHVGMALLLCGLVNAGLLSGEDLGNSPA